jgi:hypothetical protein
VPSYKTAKYLNKNLNNLINLPYTYTTKNSYEVAEELKTIHIDEHMKIVTLDIRDLCVNLPIQGILQTTKCWLSKHNHTNTTIEQTLQLLETILKQNYFQYNNQLFRPKKGIAKGSSISSTVVEFYIQFLEGLYIKEWLENKQILYYKRYLDDILIIYNQNKTNEQNILNHANSTDKHLQFKLSTEESKLINYLQLSIYRNNNIDLEIYRKLTATDTIIHFSSNHPFEHKLAVFHYYINRMLTLPITKQPKQQG